MSASDKYLSMNASGGKSKKSKKKRRRKKDEGSEEEEETQAAHHVSNVVEMPEVCNKVLNHRINSLQVSSNSCYLLITFANSLGPDQARQNIRPDLNPKCLTS